LTPGEHVDDAVIEKLRVLAPLLNRLPSKPDAECSYDALSGGLLWADEVPDLSLAPPGTFEALRGVLWYRTSLILGDAGKRDEGLWPGMERLFPAWSGVAAASENEALWLAAQELFPNWPGFAPGRRSIELRERCMELKLAAAEEMDKMFDP
jgi:hypothetical protein